MFYDPSSYELVSRLQHNSARIRAEALSLEAGVLDLHRNIAADVFFSRLEQQQNGWTPSWQVDSAEPNYSWLTYALTFYRKFMPESSLKYPITRSLLDHDAVRMAGFSLLKPLSVIAPHRHEELGNGILTCHLGLDVAPRTSFVSVEGDFAEEQQGKAIVFDGSGEHFAFNAGLVDRIVLYVEFDSSKT